MKNIFLFFLLLSTSFLAVSAQSIAIRGVVADSATRTGLSYAGVALLKLPDSAMVENTYTSDKGAFSLSAAKEGNYLLWVSYVGYKPIRKPLSITSQSVISLDTLRMVSLNASTDTAVIAARMSGIAVKGDTIAYNADAFRPKPSEVVSDVLKRMPGMQVARDGSVTAQGEQVQQVLVNNKPFFGDDPQIALKNLPADAVQEVQVYDAKSDQANFSGFNDGQTRKTINIKVKKDRANFYFGTVGAAGGGGDGTQSGEWLGSAYKANANIFRFTPGLQLSVISAANNVNSSPFSFSDLINTPLMSQSGGGGGMFNTTMQAGVGDMLFGATDGYSTSRATGANFRIMKKKTDISGSYTFLNKQDITSVLSNRQQWLESGVLYGTSSQDAVSTTNTHRFSLSVEHKFNDKTSLKWTPSGSYQTSEGDSKVISENVSNGIRLNSSNASASTSGYAPNLNNTLLLRHKFAKEGRTVSLTLTNAFSEQHRTSYNTSLFTLRMDTTERADSLNQQVGQFGQQQQYSSRISYTEPLTKVLKLEVSASADMYKSKSDRTTRAYDALSRQYEIPVARQTNSLVSEYDVYRGGASLQYARARYTLTARADVQQAQLSTQSTTATTGSSQRYVFPFLNVLPSVEYSYTISKQKTLRLNYSTNTNRPSVNDLVPVPDLSNPLRISIGNPDLKQSYGHTFSGVWRQSNTEKGRFLFMRTNTTITQNAIVYATTIDSSGRQTQMPINLNGDMSTSLNGHGSIQLGKKWDLDGGMQNNFSIRPGMINNAISKNYSMTFAPRMGLDFKADSNTTFSMMISGRAQRMYNSLQTQAATWTYFTAAEFSANTTLRHGWELATEWSATARMGLANGYNKPVILGSASIAKVVFKNQKGRITLNAYDLLNQGANYNRTSGVNYIEDTRSSLLRRYFLLGFTYRINEAPKGNQGPPPGHHHWMRR